jgi:predicted transcriptional regulator of viral defense system
MDSPAKNDRCRARIGDMGNRTSQNPGSCSYRLGPVRHRAGDVTGNADSGRRRPGNPSLGADLSGSPRRDLLRLRTLRVLPGSIMAGRLVAQSCGYRNIVLVHDNGQSQLSSDAIAQLGGRVGIASLPDVLLSMGCHFFTTADAARAARVSPHGALPALARLLDKKQAFSPARGLYVAIPPQYRSWGAVPAAWFIDELMAHLRRDYYVAFLSSAEQHGAAHQSPQVFQVIVDRGVRDRNFGRVRLRFVSNRNMRDLPVQTVNVPTGTMKVATSELTAIDLANRPEEGGGLHNVATVLVELERSGKLDVELLSGLLEHFPIAAGRRLGWLLEEFTELNLDPLADRLAQKGEPSRLDPHGPRKGSLSRRWHLRINATVEPDL